MEHEDRQLGNAARFSFFGLGFILFWWFSYFLAVAGYFSPWLLVPFCLVISAGAIMAARKWLGKETAAGKIAMVAAITASTVLMYVAEPTVFSGRDQGSISEAAFELAHTGGLPFSYPASETFFGIYGEGQALNFPGFFYREDGKLTTQFPLGYTVWLSAFTSFFGMDGFRVGNGILLTLSILSLFLLVRSFSDERYALGASAVFATAFIPSWFAKFTLTENAALFLFLFLSLNLVLFLRESRVVFFLGAFLSGLLLTVTRIEGIWMLGVAFCILFLSKQGRKFAAPKTFLFRTVPIMFAIATILVNFLVTLPFHTVMAKSLLKNLSSVASADPAALADSAGISLALWKLFALYGLLPIFIAGFAGIALLVFRKRYGLLVPALLALPTFIYFIDPNITHDHPWMLRRFLPFVFPALLVSGAIGLSVFAERKKRPGGMIAVVVFLVAFASGLPAFVRTAGFADNRELLETVGDIAPLIGENDLLLIDRDVSGDHFSIPSGPLRFLKGKNAAYFFNPEDYAKMEKGGYERIYLLTPLEHFDRWERMPVSLDFVSAFTFSTEQLETLPLRDDRFPAKRAVIQDAVLFELKPL